MITYYHINEMLNTDLSVKAKGISNRINSELNNLFNQGIFISSKRNKSSIIITFIKDENKYEIDLSHDYPFKPPKNILYNGTHFKESLSNWPFKAQHILKNKYNIGCLCCDTIISGTKWTPAINTSHIINEIDKLTKIKKEIKIILMCDRMRNKGKCYFAEFEKYLF
jgi:ubiquitin-protein ligase